MISHGLLGGEESVTERVGGSEICMTCPTTCRRGYTTFPSTHDSPVCRAYSIALGSDQRCYRQNGRAWFKYL